MGEEQDNLVVESGRAGVDWRARLSRMPASSRELLFAGIFFGGAAVVMVIVLVVRTFGHNGGIPAFSGLNLFVYAVFIFAVAVTMVTAVRAGIAARNREVIPSWAVDVARFKRFQDCLDALSLGIGVSSPPLVVTNIPSPVAYVGFYRHRALAITNDLLYIDLTDQGVEAIMAILLAKTKIDPGDDPPPGSYDHWIDKLDVNETIAGIIRRDFLDDSACLFSILADTYAARLTGRPGILKDAIEKSDRLIAENQARPRNVAARKMFVEPAAPPGRRFTNMPPRWMNNSHMLTSGTMRGRIIQLRLENLDMIELGRRQPYQQLRDGRPVTGPKGWQ